MSGPYFVTNLVADVAVHPRLMDNNIIANIKKELERIYLNKVYENYGYIEKIYGIDDDIRGGIIRAEDNSSSSIHTVHFNCRICNPIKKSTIMGKITGINNMIILAENGPIKFMIAENNIDKKNVQFKQSAYYPVNANGELINKPINKGTYVLIQVINKKIVKNKRIIIVFGQLVSVVPDDKLKDMIRSQYQHSTEIEARNLNDAYFEQNPENLLVSEASEASDESGDSIGSSRDTA